MASLNISQIKFLVVEDNPFMMALLRQILRTLGVVQIDAAKDGAEAFERMRDFNPDIVLLDWQMAPMDGLEFAKLVRASPESPNRFIPIIMITAYSEISRVTEARDAGVNEVLAKPIAVLGLYNRIRAVIERPRLFVDSSAYFGPDRRRRVDPRYTGGERRAPPKPENALVA